MLNRTVCNFCLRLGSRRWWLETQDSHLGNDGYALLFCLKFWSPLPPSSQKRSMIFFWEWERAPVPSGALRSSDSLTPPPPPPPPLPPQNPPNQPPPLLTSVYTLMQFSKQSFDNLMLCLLTTCLFMNDCCLFLSRTLTVSLSLSNVLWLFICFGTATIGTLSRRAQSVVESEQVSFVLVLKCLRARSPRLFVVVDYNQFTQQGSGSQIWEKIEGGRRGV